MVVFGNLEKFMVKSWEKERADGSWRKQRCECENARVTMEKTEV